MPLIQPNFWVHANLTKYPESAGTNTLYASTEPLADLIFKEGRVTALGSIKRSFSDVDGNPVRSRATINFGDQDRFFRALLADTQGQYLELREMTVWHQSEEGRKSGGTPNRVFTGVIRENSLTNPMGFGVVLDDWLLSQRSPFSATKKLLSNRRLTRDLFAQLHKDFINTTQRVLIGEASDAGLTDSAGNSVSKGAVEAIHVGGFFITSDGSPIPDGLEPTYMTPPTNLVATVVGSPGTTVYEYAVSALTLTGETPISIPVVVSNAPDALSDTNYIHLTWDAPPEAPEQIIAYRVMGRTTANTFLTLTTNDGTYVNPEKEYDDGPKLVAQKSYSVPSVSTAVIQVVIPGTDAVTAEVWQGFFLVGHAVNPADMHQLFGPVWETDGEPYRAALDEGVFGVDVYAPGRPGWPFSTPYIDVTDIRTGKVHRMTMMFARGSRAHYAVEGKAGFAWNMCGVEENGDGTGETIRSAFFALQWVLSELGAANDGEGYYSGLYAGLPYFKSDPTLSLIDTASIQQAQADSIELVGGIGYVMDTIIDYEISIPDFIAEFNKEYDTFSGPNRFTQFLIRLIDFGAIHSVGNHYRQGIEIRRMAPPEVVYTEIQNRINYQFWYDAAGKKYIHDAESLDHFESQEAYYGGPRESPLLGLRLISHRPTARSAMARKRLRRAWQSVYQEITTDLSGMREELGNVIFITHDRGLGSEGYVETPFIVVSSEVFILQGEVVLRGFYLGRFEGLLMGDLGDREGTDFMILGDRDSSEPPPVGPVLLS